MPVNTPCAAYETALPTWTKCRDAAGGSDAVKAKSVLYLPMLSGQDETDKGKKAYTSYLTRAMYYNATGRTVEGLAGAVLRKPMAKDHAPALIEEHLKDVTLTDVSIDALAVQVLHEVLNPGRFGILLDMPRAEPDASGTAPADPTARPFWVPYLAEQILNWATTVQDGDTVLTMLVLKEHYTEKDPTKPDDRFAMRARCRYRELVLETGTKPDDSARTQRRCLVTVHENAVDDKGKIDDKTFVETPLGPLTRRGEPLDFIPFVFFNPLGIDPSIGKPPLRDLVDVNLAHFRNSADYEWGLHHLAPTPYACGMRTTDVIQFGPTTLFSLENENAKVGLLEPSGTGLKNLLDAMQAKQQLMATLGGRLLEQQKTGVEAARTVELRQSGENSTLGSIASVVSQGLSKLVTWHAWWFGTEEKTADESVVRLNTDFLSNLITNETLKTALLGLQDSRISFETWYAVLERAELARPGVTAEEELAAIVSEAEDRVGTALDPTPPDPFLDPDADPNADPNDPNALPPKPGAKPPFLKPKPGTKK